MSWRTLGPAPLWNQNLIHQEKNKRQNSIMKKLQIILLLLGAGQLFGELPSGDVSLISATEKGGHGITILQARIDAKEGTKLITIPHLGTAALVQGKDGKEFYAVFPRKKVMHEGKEQEHLDVTVFSGAVSEDGDIHCSLTSIGPGQSRPGHVDYLLKSGSLK